ncbi:MAG: hypothetical protein ACM3PW_17865, partial [Chlamydiota bacterium]
MPVQTSSASAAPPEALPAAPSGAKQTGSRGWLGIGYGRWLWIISALGIAVRLEQYLFDRSLWLDESLMVLNLLHRSFAQLTKPLDYQLVAPLAWLFAEKSCSLLFGPSELSFHLVAIVGGALAMVVVVLLARSLLAPRAALVAVALFALSPPLIYYSSELKPYGTDPAACGLLWLAGFWALRGRLTPIKLAILAVMGAALFWFSHPLLFVAAGFGLAALISSIADRNWRRFAGFAPVFLAWAASFAVDYWLTLRISSENRHLPHAYPFFTFPIRFSTIDTTIQGIFTLQQNPPTLLLGVALFAAVIGAIYFWRQDRSACLFLVSPLLFALIASNRYLYPLPGRFFVFFTPALFLLVAAGAEEICLAARSRSVATAVFVLLFFQPLLATANVVQHHMPAEELRPVLQYVQQHQQPGDTWYIYYYARAAYTYYAEVYGLQGSDVVMGSAFHVPPPVNRNWEVFQQDFSKLRGQRVWVIFAHNWTGDGVDEPVYALHVLDTMGVRKDAHLE